MIYPGNNHAGHHPPVYASGDREQCGDVNTEYGLADRLSRETQLISTPTSCALPPGTGVSSNFQFTSGVSFAP